MFLRRRPISAGAVAFLLAGLIGYDIWRLIEDRESDISRLDAGVTRSESALRQFPQTEDEVSGRNESLSDEAPPGSMRATLLNTADGNRNHIFQMTIGDAGFECPGVRNASGVGSDGYVWRVHCGDWFIYWIEVGDFGRLLVTPVQYGDIERSAVPRAGELLFESPGQETQIIQLPPTP